jgi:MoxR-like ATPase
MNIPGLTAFINIKHCLPAVGTWRKTVHVFDERTAQAIRAALASGRPLLVRGEPGAGKSQLARAAACVLGRKFLSHVVDAHTEVQDLWYRFDAVSRLGNAQVLSVTGKEMSEKGVDDKLKAEKYLSPGILWWAFDWQNANSHSGEHPFFIPDENDPGDENNGAVLLLDEIDKADAELPNSLLETLDNGKFTVPWIKKTVGAIDGAGSDRPLVVITTNEDRQLPGAFVRRCMVLDLRLPKEKGALTHFLKERAAIHFPDEPGDEDDSDKPQSLQQDDQGNLLCKSRFHDKVLDEAAGQLFRDRQQANTLGVTPPGQAEYLDMLRVLDVLAPGDTDGQYQLLLTIKEFALKKYPGMQKEEANTGGKDATDAEAESDSADR